MKKIEGFDKYYISKTGQILDVDYNKTKKAKLLKQQTTLDGYKFVQLSKNGKIYNKKIHRLVAEAFIPNPYNKPEINHKDGNKHNNNAENLEWVNRSENMRHASANRLLHPNPRRGDEHPRPMLGRKNPNAALKRRVKVRIIETDEVFNSIIDCALAINGSDRRISECLHDRQKSHMGYHFERI